METVSSVHAYDTVDGSVSLDDLIGNHPACKLALFADIGTGVTFISAGALNVRRETLDALCTEAAIALGTGDAPTLGQTPAQYAMQVSEQGTRVFVRNPAEQTEAVVCIMRDSFDLDALVMDVGKFLQKESAA